MTYDRVMGNRSFVCMIRHAEKERVDSDTFGNSAGLTRKGKEDGFKFGLDFKSKYGEIDRIVSSPLRRCLETAEEISSAFNTEVLIERSELLGDPGAYISILIWILSTSSPSASGTVTFGSYFFWNWIPHSG